MNVLVLTPLYCIDGRDNLPQNTSAVHYLLKYWSDKANILVINEYHLYGRQLKRLFNKKEFDYFKNGYTFVKDGIDVNVVELPLFPKQNKLLAIQKKYMASKIKGILKNRSFKPDIVISHQPTCCVGQYIDHLNFNCKKICVLHITDYKHCKRDLYFREIINRNYDKIFCRTDQLYKLMSQFNLDNIDKKIVMSGVPKINTHSRETSKKNKFRILFVGKLVKRKHVDHIIIALSNIYKKYDVSLTIVGDGPEKERLTTLASELGVDTITEFNPSVPRNKVYEYMSDSNIFVMPSTGETLGLVYLEAMRQGCIPVGTKNEGIDGIIIDGENGFLVLPDDIADLEKKFIQLFEMSCDDFDILATNAKKSGDMYDERAKSFDYYSIIKNELL